MANTYYLWIQSEIYTSFGMAELLVMLDSYQRRREFDNNLTIPGMIANESFKASPIDLSLMENPSSKVYYITTRQNAGQSPRRAFYNPMHKFCKTTGEITYAKDLKEGDFLVSLGGEVRVEYIEVFDYGNSKWTQFVTDSNSPNMFVNGIMTFPTKAEDLEKFEESLNKEIIEKMEYSEDAATPINIDSLDPDFRLILTDRKVTENAALGVCI